MNISPPRKESKPTKKCFRSSRRPAKVAFAIRSRLSIRRSLAAARHCRSRIFDPCSACSGQSRLRAVAEAAQKQDGARMLEIVEELERNGQSLQHFCRELSRYWRNLLVAKIAGKPTRLIPASTRARAFQVTSALFSEEDLTRYLNLILDLYKALQESMQPRLHLELGLIKLIQASRLQPIEEALAGLQPLSLRRAYRRLAPRSTIPKRRPLQSTASSQSPIQAPTGRQSRLRRLPRRSLAPYPAPSAIRLKRSLRSAVSKGHELHC